MSDLFGRLPAELRRTLDSIAAAAGRRGIRAYLVGGAVRDLLTRRRPRDLDVVIEGDAVAFARSWATENHRTLEAPSRFGTIRTSELEAAGARLEFASSRRETYAAPAALPQVSSAPIEEDLKRRDFTVNAMALGIGGTGAEYLLDPFGGVRDLRLRSLRLLHGKSISDDPTRAFRAVRYAERLSFRIEPLTLAQIESERTAGTFDALSGARLRREIELLLGQCGPSGLRHLARLRLESTILPRLRVGASALARLNRALELSKGKRGIDRPRLLLLAWLSELPRGSAATASDRLDLRAESRGALMSIGAKRKIALRAAAGKKISGDLALDLRGWTTEEAVAAASWLSPSKARRFLERWRFARGLRLRIAGADLIRRGIAPGPAIGRAIDAVLRARMEKRITARQELAFALQEARGQ